MPAVSSRCGGWAANTASMPLVPRISAISPCCSMADGMGHDFQRGVALALPFLIGHAHDGGSSADEHVIELMADAKRACCICSGVR